MDPPGLGKENHLGSDVLQACKIQVHGTEERTVDCTNAAFTKATNQELKTWLQQWTNQGRQGKFKAWIHQHVVLPWILWLVYEFPLSTVEDFERRTSHHLHRWLGLPQSLSSNTLYGNNNEHP
ncbi:hypothetical protein N1851_000897 [Merluccius polli]|uniref:Uncharacterized protein n=1 Tax=Merluccius polli TaxID=89951 RepID=A0AA47PDT4_MERPO|nr:hypothetical protein N1851_000897 [Merluccius polli]